jgi:hypothetical protein
LAGGVGPKRAEGDWRGKNGYEYEDDGQRIGKRVISLVGNYNENDDENRGHGKIDDHVLLEFVEELNAENIEFGVELIQMIDSGLFRGAAAFQQFSDSSKGTNERLDAYLTIDLEQRGAGVKANSELHQAGEISILHCK